MPKLVCDFELRVQSPNGMHTVVFAKDEVREVPEHLYDMCRKAGAFPPDGKAPEKIKAPEAEAKTAEQREDEMQQLVDVVASIYAEGDASLLTESDGLPRLSEVKKRYNLPVNKAVLNEAIVRFEQTATDNASQ